jgi:sigma-B regulation protein RsbU (phosphoserine phosphatase)
MAGKKAGEITLSQTVINSILAERQALVISDARDDERFAQQQSIVTAGIISAMAAPIFDQERVMGILYADSRSSLLTFDEKALRLLVTLGSIVGANLLNMALVDERQQRQVLDAELKRASLIQTNLLNRPQPEIPGYQLCALQEQCNEVGGDLYDITRLTDGRILLLLGDVCGKGMPAALLMSNILASFRILYRDPGFDLLRAVNVVSRHLWEESDPSDYATIFIAVIDTTNNVLQYVNAGHDAPVLMRGDGACERLSATGMMIGIVPETSWQVTQVGLHPDDLLLVFSDGIPDEQCGEEFFGEDRMIEEVSAVREHPLRDIAKHLISSVNAFLAGSPRVDDITMLLLRRIV